MILFGHIGITVFSGSLLSLALLYVLTGSVLPDLIDKSLFIVGLGPSSRFIGHTLFMGILISFMVYIIWRKKIYSASLLFGYYVHLLEDSLHFMPWFYPFINYDFPFYTGPVFTPFNIIMEFVGLVLFVYIIRTNSHFRNSLIKIFNSLKIRTNRKSSE